MRPPEKPLLVVIELKGSYNAVILFPNKISVLGEWLSGPFEAIGSIEDKGYKFSTIKRNNFPHWIKNRIASQYTIYGIATVKSFPA